MLTAQRWNHLDELKVRGNNHHCHFNAIDDQIFLNKQL
jgi:hypothetical protein